MRAIYIFLVFIIFIFNGCTSIEVAKELTKMTKSTATSIKNITKPKEQEIKEEEIIEVPSIIIEKKQSYSVSRVFNINILCTGSNFFL